MGVVVAFRTGEDPDRVNTAGSTQTTGTTAPPGVVVSTTQAPTTSSTTASAAATTTSKVRRTTTTAAAQVEFTEAPDVLECAETTPAEPAEATDGWQDYWTTKPEPNDPLRLAICVADNTPKVGTTVKLYLLAEDPDATIGQKRCDIFVSWASNAGSGCREGSITAPQEPQPTPKEEKGYVKMTFVHVYDEPGEWIIDVSAWSGPEPPEPHPYASYNSVELRLNVHR